MVKMNNIIAAIEAAMQQQKDRIEFLEWSKKELESKVESLEKELEEAWEMKRSD